MYVFLVPERPEVLVRFPRDGVTSSDEPPAVDSQT